MLNLLKTKINQWPVWTAVLCGGALALSYPPVPLGFLSTIAWVPMLLLIKDRTKKEVFRLFFLFGLTATAGTLYWIGNVIAPGVWHMILIGVILLCGYWGLFFGLCGLWGHFLYRKTGPSALFLLPPFWVLLEYFRALSELSFPWCTIGYTWGHYTALLQMLPVTGVYAYTLLILEISVVLYLLIENGWNRMTRTASVSVLAILILLGAYGARTLQKEEPAADTIRLSMLQPNVDQLVRWDEAFIDSAYIRNREMTLRAYENEKPDLIVWTETSLPMYFLKRKYYRKRVQSLSDSLNTPILLGSLDYQPADNKYKKFNFYNCAFWVRPGEKDVPWYGKIRLVPFSEYLPFTGLIPILNTVDLGEADFSSGPRPEIFRWGKADFAPSICYEMAYPQFIRQSVKNGANLLINITNDAWFGRTSGPFQHLNIVKYRCIENRIWTARCANSGISAIIDDKGRFLSRTRLMERTILNGTVRLVGKPTKYSRYGDWFIGVCFLLCLPYFLIIGKRFIRKR